MAIDDENSKLEEIHTYFEWNFYLVVYLQTNHSFPPELALAIGSSPTQALQNRVIRTFEHLPHLQCHVGDAAPSPPVRPITQGIGYATPQGSLLLIIVQFYIVRYCMRWSINRDKTRVYVWPKKLTNRNVANSRNICIVHEHKTKDRDGFVNAYFLEIETLNLSKFLASFELVVQNGIWIKNASEIF